MTAAMPAAPPAGDTGKRPTCHRCRRPERVCYCPALPKEVFKLGGKVIILQHPFESKRRTATAPMLAHCLDNIHIVRGRKFKHGDALGRTLDEAARGEYPLYVLFPGPGAADLASVVAAQQQPQEHLQSKRIHPSPLEAEQQQQQREQQQRQGGEVHRAAVGREPARARSPSGSAASAPTLEPAGGSLLEAGTTVACTCEPLLPGAEEGGAWGEEVADWPPTAAADAAPAQQLTEGGPCQWALVAIDGTWQQAREMFNALESRLVGPGGPGIRVQLALPASRQQQLHQLQQQQQEQQLLRRQERRRQRQAQWRHRKQQQQEALLAQGREQHCSAGHDGANCSAGGFSASDSMLATGTCIPASMGSGASAAADRTAAQAAQQVVAPAAAAAAEDAAAVPLVAAALSGAAATLAAGEPAGTHEGSLSEDEACLLMMEPLPGCVTTCEAVARAVSILERDGGRIKDAVMQPLLYVARLQAQWDPAVKARLSGVGAQYSTSRRHFGMGKSLGLRH